MQLAQLVRDLGRADSGEVDIQHAVEVMLLNVFLEGLFDIPASSVPGGRRAAAGMQRQLPSSGTCMPALLGQGTCMTACTSSQLRSTGTAMIAAG